MDSQGSWSDKIFFQAENLWFTRARFCVKIHSVEERYKREERYKQYLNIEFAAVVHW